MLLWSSRSFSAVVRDGSIPLSLGARVLAPSSPIPPASHPAAANCPGAGSTAGTSQPSWWEGNGRCLGPAAMLQRGGSAARDEPCFRAAFPGFICLYLAGGRVPKALACPLRPAPWCQKGSLHEAHACEPLGQACVGEGIKKSQPEITRQSKTTASGDAKIPPSPLCRNRPNPG